jgi:hypothetical protein
MGDQSTGSRQHAQVSIESSRSISAFTWLSSLYCPSDSLGLHCFYKFDVAVLDNLLLRQSIFDLDYSSFIIHHYRYPSSSTINSRHDTCHTVQDHLTEQERCRSRYCFCQEYLFHHCKCLLSDASLQPLRIPLLTEEHERQVDWTAVATAAGLSTAKYARDRWAIVKAKLMNSDVSTLSEADAKLFVAIIRGLKVSSIYYQHESVYGKSDFQI